MQACLHVTSGEHSNKKQSSVFAMGHTGSDAHERVPCAFLNSDLTRTRRSTMIFHVRTEAISDLARTTGGQP